jgi:hypothetical protein
VIAVQQTGIRCGGCGSRFRHADDRYHLRIPPAWMLDDVHAWGEEGATIGWLERRGVRIAKLCVTCQAKEPPAK